jgi:hypothetical protein
MKGKMLISLRARDGTHGLTCTIIKGSLIFQAIWFGYEISVKKWIVEELLTMENIPENIFGNFKSIQYLQNIYLLVYVNIYFNIM